jgi:hypothetical protein
MNNNAVLEVGLDQLDLEAAARVAQRYVLQEIFLMEAKIDRAPMISYPEVLSLEHKCSTDTLTSSDKENYMVRCDFRVTAFSENSSEIVLTIEASFFNSYVKKPDIQLPVDDVDTLLTYAEYLGTINPISDAWPYWREFVHSMSARMGFPALTVPLLEIRPKKPEEKAKKDSGKKESTRRKKPGA